MNNQELKDKIKSFASLKYNWDSYGASPVNQETINLALKMVDFLPLLSDKNWCVVPLCDCGIMFENDNETIVIWSGE